MIGGTGLDHLPHFRKAAVLHVSTPWGLPSSPITILEHPSPTTGKPIPIAFLARHGPHHELTPSEIPVRANIAAFRKIGVRCIIAFSAAGSLAEEVKPRDFVVPDQCIDRTKGIRPHTFFEDGFVLHVPFADPFDNKVGDVVRKCGHSLEGEGVVLHDKGTVIVMGTLRLLFLCFVIVIQLLFGYFDSRSWRLLSLRLRPPPLGPFVATSLCEAPLRSSKDAGLLGASSSCLAGFMNSPNRSLGFCWTDIITLYGMEIRFKRATRCKRPCANKSRIQ